MEVKCLVARRGVIRAKVTKCENVFIELIKENEHEKLFVCRDQILQWRKDLDEFDSEILPTCNEKEIESQAELIENYREVITRLLSSLNFAIQRHSDNNHIGTQESTVSSHERTSRTKLPQLKIKSFKGDSLKWQEFWDSYESIVHSDCSLSPVIKFNYLLSFLEDEAKRTLDGISVTNDNYTIAIDMLRERYGNKEVIVFAHLDKLFSMKRSTDETRMLKSTIDECEKHVRSLEAFGSLTTDQIFTPLILSKLPQEFRINLHRKNGKKPWELSTLRQSLKDEIIARELGEQQFGESKSVLEYKISRDNPQQNKIKSTTQSFVAHSTTNKFSCIFCQKSHYADECTDYKDVQERKNKLEDRCFSCLRQGHRVSDCRIMKPCYYCHRKDHHRSLCFFKFGPTKRNENLHKKDSSTKVLRVSVQKSECDKFVTKKSPNLCQRVLTQTAMIDVTNPLHQESRAARVRLILDTGANRSFISEKLAKHLLLKPINFENLAIATFGSYSKKEIKCPIVEIALHQIDGSRKELNVSVVPKISCSTKMTSIDIDLYPQLIGLPLADPGNEDDENQEIELLIGNDFYYDFVKMDGKVLGNGLVALNTMFGWIPSGRISYSKESSEAQSMLVIDSNSQKINFCLERFWNLESVGIKDCALIKDDDRALHDFQETVRFSNGRYEVKWPWKNDEPELPENYQLSYGRLISLIKRLGKTPDVMEKYNNIILDQLERGIIEKVTLETEEFSRKHYLPHHCVSKADGNHTKLRIVYDASAKSRKNANSLNDCLLRGPVILEDLVGILMRFRLHSVAVSCDIEKAFLQIGLQNGERDVVRFLWLKDLKNNDLKNNIQVYRFCRVPFGVISSPFLLGATVAHHLKLNNSKLVDDVQRNIYVDNILVGRSSHENSDELYTNLKSIMKKASMNLREWYSNSEEFLMKIPAEDRVNDKVITSILGVQWNIKTDTIEMKGPKIEINDPITKRQVLKTISEVFDPLGLCAPVTISSKILMQELWKQKLDWEDILPQNLLGRWIGIQKDLMKIHNIKRPRLVNNDYETDVTFDLHCFVDASEKAYAACIYLSVKTNEKTMSNLVFCKARLSPVKEISIPRLELMAAIIGVRAIGYVEDNLDLIITTRTLWSDSKCVLYWICNEKMKPVFIENRLKEIRKYQKLQFRYIPTSLNPADLPTRGLRVEELMRSDVWWHGPIFLLFPENEWPEKWTPVDMNEECQEHNTKEVHIVEIHDLKDGSPFGIDAEKFSSLKKLLRVTCWTNRFILGCRNKNLKFNMTLTALELREARILWEKSCQKMFYSEELKKLENGSSTGLVRQLGLFVQDGIIRCRGRFKNADMTYDEKYPVLLSKKSYFSELTIIDYHVQLLHAGARHTLSKIREKYWIPQGRSTVQKILKNCLMCRKYEGASYSVPPAPPLPSERLTEGFPFTYTGIDYLGPLYIVDNSNNHKVWICLFTCAVIRGIHLEVVRDLSTEEFLLALRRFISKRGKPQLIISDNATTFKLAKRTLKSAWEKLISDEAIHNYAANNDIQWRFITEYSPWMGGFYERMVGSVKRALRKVIGKSRFDLIHLQTIVVEIEAVINSRPLTYIESEFDDHMLLTPAHFMGGNFKTGFPDVVYDEDNFEIKIDSRNVLLKKWKKGQNILNNYWSCWKNDYLQQLREKGQQTFKGQQIPDEGHIVLIGDKLPRGRWKVGKITKLITSRDGFVRSAEITLPNKRLLQRPIKLLYPMENYFKKNSDQTYSKNFPISPKEHYPNLEENVVDVPPQRKAALKAKMSLKKLFRRECHDDS